MYLYSFGRNCRRRFCVNRKPLRVLTINSCSFTWDKIKRQRSTCNSLHNQANKVDRQVFCRYCHRSTSHNYHPSNSLLRGNLVHIILFQLRVSREMGGHQFLRVQDSRQKYIGHYSPISKL